MAAKQAGKDVYIAELKRDIANVMYPALKNVNIDMPDFYSAGGTGQSAPTSLDVFATLAAQSQLENRTDTTNQAK